MKYFFVLSFLFFAKAWCAQPLHDSLPIHNLVFEGAGIRGIAYCGGLMELNERNLLNAVSKVAGTSSGAITACFYSLGYTPNEIFELVGQTNFADFNDGSLGAIGGFYRMKKRLGWYKGDAFLEWLEGNIALKTGNKDLTFAQLKSLAAQDANFKELVVAATSINHQCTLYFEAGTYPHMRIADAVRASMAVPLYYEPVVIDSAGQVVPYATMGPQHHLCVDGGFTANFIINYFDTEMPARTLGLRIDSDEQIAEDLKARNLAYQPITNTGDFMKAFYYITKENLNRINLTEADWQRTVSISDCAIGPKVKHLSAKEKNLLINAGRQGVINYLK